MKFPAKATLVLVSLAIVAAPPLARAQDQGGEEGAGPGPGVTVVQLPRGEPTVETQVVVPGYPQPGFDPNAHLPSSSRGTTDTSRPSDGFDLGRRSEGPASVKGGANGSYVVEGQFVPESHSVRRGDTLWDISGRYYTNPYAWPQVWALNPQLQNPHWIYPGDRIRLRDPSEGPTRGSIGFGANQLSRGGRVPTKTIFLRELGWVDDVKKDTWGELVASPDDQMLLSEGDDVYLRLSDDHEVSIGQELTIFREIKKVKSGDVKGELVTVRGTARVDRYNPKTHMVRARLIESLDVVERTDRVGAVLRRLDVVPPVGAEADLEAKILAAVYPYQLVGQHQVVFIDKGEKDGVKPGQRFFAVRRGDRWLQQLGSAGRLATVRPRVQDERPAQVDEPKFGVDEELLPDETYAELRVVHVRERTAAALVTHAMYEVERDAVLVSRKGL
ncbi:LysM peptidoglycan-binding domain-containing protein [Sorangium sp. So ce426]|uniref:LysM peptidoglycan-binding domain-containing protein n=1 Tax=Sorangium sp. So ce426 TaxID=3133312 RepID=UPI003F5B1CF0